MHCSFCIKREHFTSSICIFILRYSSANFTASITAKYESLLQHLGPPFSLMLFKALEVIRFAMLHSSIDRGVALVTMETNIPVLIPAPQAPQYPHIPPGMSFPLLYISKSASFNSISLPGRHFYMQSVRMLRP